jgi:hypothetical protein
VIHFYHLWLGGDWKSIAEEHFAALRAAEFPGRVNVGLVGSADARAEAHRWLDRRWNWQTANAATEGFEEVTLHALHKMAASLPDDTPVLYAHNKGSFHPVSRVGINENTPWRQEMTDYLVNAYQTRVDELSGHDVVAWHWLPAGIVGPTGIALDCTVPAGNFWWSRAGYLRKLPLLPPKLVEDNRIEAETWLAKGDPRVKCLSTEWPSVSVGHWEFQYAVPGFPHTGRWVLIFANPVD